MLSDPKDCLCSGLLHRNKQSMARISRKLVKYKMPIVKTMDRVDEMRLALHRWTGAGLQDIKPEKILAGELKAVFNVPLRAQDDKHKRYIVVKQDEFTKITGGKAEYHKEYQIDGYTGEIEGGFDGYVILWAKH